jgi:hypothetical protein
VLGDSGDAKVMVIREPKSDEAMPAVLREGAPVKEFEHDFFLVSLAHGQPNENNTKFNIMKRYDFPVMNRFGKKPTPNDFRSFMQGTKNMKNSFERFSCFQALIYLSEMLDIDTALAIGRNVSQEKNIDSALVELLESFI